MAREPKATDTVEPVDLKDALGERYLAYALSTIMSRALPDVRDGLKPVHRRILYAMRELRLEPGQAYRKSAKIVGDVMGGYHPHGDQSIYDALVRLAQDFASRYPLVDGQGNFGNIDGDNPAAMRYTESRLTRVAQMLLDGIDQDTVDFRPTYDGTGAEPVVLPGGFPNLLANGANGIAVGMATSIPPHNAAEVATAALALIENPDLPDDRLIDHIPGPDYPTGGIIVEPREVIAEAYRTGRGGFRTRARWHTEQLARGQYVIVVTEIPYQVQKSKLIERIAELIETKKVAALADVRDESAEDIRIVIEPRARTIEPEALMEILFRQTELETRVPLNMNVLDASRTPRVMSLKEVIRAFLDHRRDVLVRRAGFRLGKIEERLHVLEGYLIVYLNLDEVIRIIREEDDPKAELMAVFELSEAQTEAILNMRLRSLRKLEEMEIRKEHKALTAEARELRKLLKSDAEQWKGVVDELRTVIETFGPKTPLGRRRTSFAEAPTVTEIAAETLIEKEPVTVIVSAKGWVRTMRGHVGPDTEVKYREGDEGRWMLHAQTTDQLLLFGSNGRFYTLGVDRLPGGRGQGEPIRLMVDLGQDEDIVALKVFEPEGRLLVAASSGHGFLVDEAEMVAQKRVGRQVLNLADGARAVLAVRAAGDHVAVIGENRKLLLFPLAELPTMARGRGVLLQRYRDGGLADARVFTLAEGLVIGGTRSYTLPEPETHLGARASAGRMVPRGFPRAGKLH
ncbi:MAG: DNA topoisomerase IV subunit A [Alphaproteobacteria bacterium]|nr:DNA topoisomerase IV subunit A [Alphaproteobacteria bacterium]